ncbi:PAS domain S-box protein [candidate division KSB3 bacterium]|uniref:PAS domain S-box protein n=1 Tax=candidate division KSB3 bacterium TaxID=2044937 RepID=A0A9D5K0A8_9BACT|nr:PAS domain S-box protein [candidate division KSB3 bacterium]MBD3327518.1 PAS domain S-box protein [candidate division KSB3 bacterium]
MMYSIGCIAPYPELGELFAEVCRELHKDILINIGDLEEGARQAITLEEQGLDVVISRGGTAIAIQELVTDLPVVEVQISGFDVIRRLHQAKQQADKVAVAGFEPFTYGLEGLGEILGLTLQVVTLREEWYDQHQYIEQRLRAIQREGYQCVVGDHISVKIAEELGMAGFLIKSGKEAVLQAILEAERVANVRKQEMEKAKRLKSIIDLAYEGIISIDQHGIIDTFNPKAEEIVARKAYKVIGKPIQEVFPGMNLIQSLQTGHQQREIVLNVEGTTILANIIPISINQEVVRVVVTFQKVSHIQRMEQRIREEFSMKGHTADNTFQDIVGQTPLIDQIKEEARDYAQIDLPILISGETGTGKELFAQAIHNASARHNKPFVAFNCAALPESLLESELFGYVEGAFTGARKQGRAGLFEQANGGTIFLDEISEVPKGIQARLLRVLQEHKIRKLGDDRITSVDVRIIVATNKNLSQLVDEGIFREDLYYRINVLNIHLPPLQERREDIPILVNFFIKKYRQKVNKIVEGISQEGMAMLSTYSWPGNVRQLENVVERLMVRTRERYIMTSLVRDVMKSLRGYMPASDHSVHADAAGLPQAGIPLPAHASLAEIEKLIIRQVVQEERGNKMAAAERLKIGRTTLWRKLKE